MSELPPATRSLLLVGALDEGADLGEILAAASLVDNAPTTGPPRVVVPVREGSDVRIAPELDAAA